MVFWNGIDMSLPDAGCGGMEGTRWAPEVGVTVGGSRGRIGLGDWVGVFMCMVMVVRCEG